MTDLTEFRIAFGALEVVHHEIRVAVGFAMKHFGIAVGSHRQMINEKTKSDRELRSLHIVRIDEDRLVLTLRFVSAALVVSQRILSAQGARTDTDASVILLSMPCDTDAHNAITAPLR